MYMESFSYYYVDYKYKRVNHGSCFPHRITKDEIGHIKEDNFFLNENEAENKLEKFISNNQNHMGNIASTLKKITRKEPEKTFVKVGFINENEEITQKGLEALNYILWEQNKEKLKEIADKIYAEENND